MLDADMPTLKQTYRLLVAGISVHICTLRFRMEFIFAEYIPIRFHARRSAGSTVARCRDSVGISRVLINLILFEPLSCVTVIRCNQMKVCRVHSFRKAECFHLAGQQEIERLDLIWVGLALIQLG